MAYLMEILGAADGTVYEHDLFLAEFDADAFDGRGFVRLTDVPAKAIQFPSQVAVMDAWRTQSKVRPIRDDGRPNRPLTAYHVLARPHGD